MIDTHCHLLPGIDDGPENVPEAIELASRLADAGVRTVACTPHFSRRFPTDHAEAARVLANLNGELGRHRIPLHCVLGAEVAPVTATEAADETLLLRRIGPRHLLVELEHDTPAGIIPVIVERLTGLGLAPVLAHPERSRAVRRRLDGLDLAKEAGAVIQVVAPSLTGRWGDETAEFAWSLLESGRADLLAGDCHAARHAERLPGILESVGSRLGADALIRLTETNPARVLDGSS